MNSADEVERKSYLFAKALAWYIEIQERVPETMREWSDQRDCVDLLHQMVGSRQSDFACRLVRFSLDSMQASFSTPASLTHEEAEQAVRYINGEG